MTCHGIPFPAAFRPPRIHRHEKPPDLRGFTPPCGRARSRSGLPRGGRTRRTPVGRTRSRTPPGTATRSLRRARPDRCRPAKPEAAPGAPAPRRRAGTEDRRRRPAHREAAWRNRAGMRRHARSSLDPRNDIPRRCVRGRRRPHGPAPRTRSVRPRATTLPVRGRLNRRRCRRRRARRPTPEAR